MRTKRGLQRAGLTAALAATLAFAGVSSTQAAWPTATICGAVSGQAELYTVVNASPDAAIVRVADDSGYHDAVLVESGGQVTFDAGDAAGPEVYEVVIDQRGTELQAFAVALDQGRWCATVIAP